MPNTPLPEWEKLLASAAHLQKIVADPRVKATAGLAAWAKGPVVLAEEDGEVIPYWRVANRGPRPHRVWR